VIDGGGATITTGGTATAQSKGFIMAKDQLEITGWNVFGDTSGSINVDIWTASYTAFPTFTKISGGAQTPSLATAQKSGGSNTGWSSPTIAAGNLIQFRVNSAPTVTVNRVTVALNVAYT
jgi:hypothetical protein